MISIAIKNGILIILIILIIHVLLKNSYLSFSERYSTPPPYAEFNDITEAIKDEIELELEDTDEDELYKYLNMNTTEEVKQEVEEFKELGTFGGSGNFASFATV